MTTATVPPNDAAAPALLDVEQVAALLNCSTRHVYRMQRFPARAEWP